MKTFTLNTNQLKSHINELSVGDKVILSGTVYTARDAAHKRLSVMLEKNEKLPFDLDGATIYYAGPTPTPENLPIGSCGPTTSTRMDYYTPLLLDNGLLCMIGKGNRESFVVDSMVRNRALYLCAIGGAGALAAKCITKCEVIAFGDLGCESVKKLTFNNFPLTVAIDSKGNNIFKK